MSEPCVTRPVNVNPERGAARAAACPTPELHRGDAPTGHDALTAWVDGMLVSHRCEQCPGCGQWVVWLPRSVPRSAPRDLS
jgi:hypothetical protein